MTCFEVFHNSKKSKSRLGEINTSHGVIKTPSFVAVGTKGTIKALTPELVKNIGTQVAFVNTYHLVTHPGSEIIEKSGGIHKYSNLSMPLMSDSGGFQVFSLALNNKVTRKAKVGGEEEPLLIKITNDGVKFRSTFDGKIINFSPEESLKYQSQIGADINMAFDECIYYGSTYEYSKSATNRTHNWLKRSIAEYKKSKKNHQYLYGVIQGGVFEDLRKESAEFVVSQNTPGIAIGGVSVGETKKEMRDQVKWVSDYLPADRPVHLLGVGQIDDIVDLVKYGIDTFDCVEPTRLARMGILYDVINKNNLLSTHKEIDITKSVYRNNLERVVEGCDCYVCNSYTKSYIHHLFKQRELLGYTLATYHNLWTMEKLFERIRELIGDNKI